MKVIFHENGWEDYLSWFQSDHAVLGKVNALIEDVRRHPFQGIGKPEPLKGAAFRVVVPTDYGENIVWSTGFRGARERISGSRLPNAGFITEGGAS